MKLRALVKTGKERSGEGLLLAFLMCSPALSYGQTVDSQSTLSSSVSSSCSNLGHLADPFGSSTTITPSIQKSPCANHSIQQTLVVNGITRTFMLYVPGNYRPGKSALVIALHGRGENVADMESGSHLDDKSNEEGFAVAYPVGLADDAFGLADWNYFYSPFYLNGPDDVGFFRAIIDALGVQLHPDQRRIYLAGGSAGGFMAQRAGVELSDRLAAIAVVEGGIFVLGPTTPPSVPPVAAPVSVLLLKGDQDAANQYCGAVFPTFGLTEASADQDFDYWTGSSANQCSDVDPAAQLCLSVGVGDAQANVTPGIPSALTRKQGLSCKQHTAVRLYRLLGGQDFWNLNPMNVPGKVPFSPDLDARTGVTTNDIIWKFFEDHPKKDGYEQE